MRRILGKGTTAAGLIAAGLWTALGLCSNVHALAQQPVVDDFDDFARSLAEAPSAGRA